MPEMPMPAAQIKSMKVERGAKARWAVGSPLRAKILSWSLPLALPAMKEQYQDRILANKLGGTHQI